MAENGHFWRSEAPKMRFFFFKISKFRFSQSVRISECIADVVSFFPVLPPKWPKMVENGHFWPSGRPKNEIFFLKDFKILI